MGAGSWGTALASLLAGKLPSVTLWCREPEVAAGITATRHNPLYLPELELPANIRPVTDMRDAVQEHDVLVMTIPTPYTRAMLQQIHACDPDGCRYFVSASKGIEIESLTPLSAIYQDVLGRRLARRVCYLSGPSFAREVVQQQPTAVVLACQHSATVHAMQLLFSTPVFRTYRSRDILGVQLGGALKNVVAIAAGISDGLGFGHNTRAALITRGIAEISRFGVALGGKARTFQGLSGLGDLLLTATSPQSRNYRVGLRIGQGEAPASFLADQREVAEGVKTAYSVRQIAVQRELDMPITQAVHAVLYEGHEVRSAVQTLMARHLKAE
jgi:glycerol-3-phosphate dehydrogenase (NAD(P)+)